ncbi:MAG: glyoxalase [Ilumatobacteraceae bacterium]|nr:glyoxalase [Ilumatobacteraceae bacterium]
MSDPTTSDPFDILRRPDAPIAPDPAFARRLHQRLTAELAPMLGTSAIQQQRTITMTVTPYFVVRGASAALDFYRDAFGAVETQRLVGDDGRIGHAEIIIGGSPMMLADEYPEVDAVGPATRGGPTCTFNIDVGTGPAVDETIARAVSLGATVLREPADQFHGNRSGTITDPFGQRWTITAAVEQLSTAEYAARAAQDNGHGTFELEVPATDDRQHQVKHHDQGDLYYFTLQVADRAMAKRFFGAVLGWQFGPEPPAASDESGHIENISAPPGGVNDAIGGTGARLYFVVDDIHAAVARVRANGGTADEPVEYPSGWSADCVDDQGTVFSLSVPTPEYTR